MRHTIWHAFIAPFTDPKRAQIYGATGLGLMGFYLANLTFSYHIADLGLPALALFWLIYFGLTGFVLMPVLSWMYGRYSIGITTGLFLSLLLFGFALAWSVGNASALGLSVAYSCSAMAYWTAYHLCMFTHSSANNRGNEVAIAYTVMGLGSGLGYLVSGLTLQAGHVSLGLIIAFLSLGIGTFLLLRLLKTPSEKLENYWMEFHLSLKRADLLARMLAISVGMSDVLCIFLFPSWLKFKGVEPKTAGGILALQVIVRIILTPFAGGMTNQMHGQEVILGMFLFLVGWILLALPLSMSLAVQAIFTLFIWVGAFQLLGCGLDKRWYEHKSPLSVGVREMFLNIGRLIAGPVGLIVLQYSPNAFPLLGIITVCLVSIGLFSVLYRNRKLRLN
jgi:MFS family permease